MNRDFICVQNKYECNAEVDKWAHDAYGLGYGYPTVAVIQPDGKTAQQGFKLELDAFQDFLWHTTVDWREADKLAESGSIDELKKFLTKNIRDEFCDSAYVIYRPKDLKRDGQWCRIRWKHSIILMDLKKKNVAYLRVGEGVGEVVRRGYRRLLIHPPKNKNKVEVRALKFVPLSSKEACSISGTAVRPDGTPAKNAQITVDTEFFVKCDENGKFEITGLCPGRHHVYFQNVTKDSNHSLARNVDLQKGAKERMDFTLKLTWQREKAPDARTEKAPNTRTDPAP